VFVEALSNLDQSFAQKGDMPLSLHVNTKGYFSQAESKKALQQFFIETQTTALSHFKQSLGRASKNCRISRKNQKE